MKKYRLTFLFTQAPFGTSISREGLDALLAASAFCNEDEIAICFIQDGVYNLIQQQKPELILQKDHISTFKLIELYDLTECFISQEAVEKRQLQQAEWLFDVNFINNEKLTQILAQSEKVLTF